MATNRNSKASVILTVIASLLFILTSPGIILAQESPLPTPETIEEEAPEREDALTKIASSINSLSTRIAEVETELKAADTPAKKEELTAALEKLKSQKASREASFAEVASGVDPSEFLDVPTESDFDWSKELNSLVQPIINELKRASSRPREMDKLRTTVAELESRLKALQHAQKNLDTLISRTENNKGYGKYISETKKEWEALESQIKTNLSIAKSQLEQKLAEQTSLADSLENIFQLFFRSRGKNLLLALAAAGLFWFLLRRIHTWIKGHPSILAKDEKFVARAVYFSFFVGRIIGTILVFLIALYSFGDWVLLIFSILLLFGVVWTSKHAFPIFWKQSMLLLNMGSVRQGERVVLNGIPWHVRSVNLYAQLSNPLLQGGLIRVPLNDLVDLRSRPSSEGEAFFPTKEGDWVLISDDVFGRIVLQSPEVVRMVMLGGSIKTFPTTDFISLSPRVLSSGFRVSFAFGIDYKHQSIVTGEVLELLKQFLSQLLAKSGYDSSVKNISIEFDEAAASSLNVRVICDFSGEVAADYWKLNRLLQKGCVDASTKEGWEIPFTQVTLHVPNSVAVNQGQP